MFPRRNRPDAERRYVAWQSFLYGDTVIAQGTTLPGSDPVVRAYERFFVDADTPRERWPRPEWGDISAEPPEDVKTTRIL